MRGYIRDGLHYGNMLEGVKKAEFKTADITGGGSSFLFIKQESLRKKSLPSLNVTPAIYNTIIDLVYILLVSH